MMSLYDDVQLDLAERRVRLLEGLIEENYKKQEESRRIGEEYKRLVEIERRNRELTEMTFRPYIESYRKFEIKINGR